MKEVIYSLLSVAALLQIIGEMLNYIGISVKSTVCRGNSPQLFDH